MQPTLVVLAAGMGSRYGSLKQIDPFGPNGETIIDYSVFDAVRAGFEKIVLVIRESLLSDFEELYLNKFSKRVEVDYVFQELHNLPSGIDVPAERTKPWGTGHAVMVAGDKVKAPFAVINADDFYGASSFELMVQELRKLDPDTLGACMVGFVLGNTISDHGYVSRGVCELDRNGSLSSITERTHITKEQDGVIYYQDGNDQVALDDDQVVSMNLMGFTPPAFDLMKAQFAEFIQTNYQNPKAEFYIPTILDHVARRRAVPVVTSNEKWLGVTYQEDKPLVMARLKELHGQGIYPNDMWD